MNNPLTEARRRGAVLWLEGGTVRFRAPPGALSQELRIALTQRKQDVATQLRREESLEGAHQALEAAVSAISRLWCALPPDRRPDLDPAEDLRLERDVEQAFLSGDPAAAHAAVRRWKEAWEAVLP